MVAAGGIEWRKNALQALLNGMMGEKIVISRVRAGFTSFGTNLQVGSVGVELAKLNIRDVL